MRAVIRSADDIDGAMREALFSYAGWVDEAKARGEAA